jgi:hypothetical protein
VGRVKRFRAVLEKGNRALGWTIARVPFDPAEVWKERVRLRVKGEVNGFGFRTSLFPAPAAFPDPARLDGEGAKQGRFYLLVSRAMQVGAGVGLGEMAEFRLEPDLEPREAELPDELAVLLDEEEGLRAWYGGLSEYMRREIGKWVLGVKSEAARLRRAEQMAERLLATMEAEVELPPVVEAAFRLRPKARAGWARMTAVQRRGELCGVFYYRTVEARQRRVEKLVEVAERH